jgi:hypothetical protein
MKFNSQSNTILINKIRGKLIKKTKSNGLIHQTCDLDDDTITTQYQIQC